VNHYNKRDEHQSIWNLTYALEETGIEVIDNRTQPGNPQPLSKLVFKNLSEF
jgi:hypothetical protein